MTRSSMPEFLWGRCSVTPLSCVPSLQEKLTIRWNSKNTIAVPLSFKKKSLKNALKRCEKSKAEAILILSVSVQPDWNSVFDAVGANHFVL